MAEDVFYQNLISITSEGTLANAFLSIQPWLLYLEPSLKNQHWIDGTFQIKWIVIMTEKPL